MYAAGLASASGSASAGLDAFATKLGHAMVQAGASVPDGMMVTSAVAAVVSAGGEQTKATDKQYWPTQSPTAAPVKAHANLHAPAHMHTHAAGGNGSSGAGSGAGLGAGSGTGPGKGAGAGTGANGCMGALVQACSSVQGGGVGSPSHPSACSVCVHGHHAQLQAKGCTGAEADSFCSLGAAASGGSEVLAVDAAVLS